MAAKRVFAVRWTWGHHKVYALKKDALAHCRRWKEEYEAKGWRTRAAKSPDGGFVAYSPEYDPNDDESTRQYYRLHGTPESLSHACLIEVYDAETKRRIYPEFKPKPERKPVEKKPRRGRKPVGA